MRWITFVLLMLFVLCANANEVLGKDGTRAILALVDPAIPETSARAEETLVGYGKDALPDMSAVFHELCAQRRDAEQAGKWDLAYLLEAQTTVLDRAMVRLQTGFNWPQLIRMWVKQQYKPDQQGIAETMPEPVRITDPQLTSAFPAYLFYIFALPPVSGSAHGPGAAVVEQPVRGEEGHGTGCCRADAAA